MKLENTLSTKGCIFCTTEHERRAYTYASHTGHERESLIGGDIHRFCT